MLMSADLANDEGVEVPEVPERSGWVHSVVPWASVPNPLDLAGRMRAKPDVADQVLDPVFPAAGVRQLHLPEHVLRVQRRGPRNRREVREQSDGRAADGNSRAARRAGGVVD